MSNAITKNTYVTRNAELHTSRIGKEMAMMDKQTGNYIGLNYVAACIWDTLEEPLSVEQIVSRMLERFSVSPEQCEAETINCLRDMNRNNLVHLN